MNSTRITKTEEDYLFKVVNKVLNWAEVKATPEEVANLVMLDIINIKRSVL